jgi:arginyl-tRNA synthetase
MNLKDEIKNVLKKTFLEKFHLEGELRVEVPPNPELGDFSANISSLYPKGSALSFDGFVDSFSKELSKRDDIFERVSKKGGYINIFLKNGYLFGHLGEIITSGDTYGCNNSGGGEKVLVEYVSTNPTGPLNIVNARAGVVGDVLVNLLNFSGYDADAEFYINDAGRQIDMLGVSGECRFQELFGEKHEIPEDGYKGEYIKDFVKKFKEDEEVKNMSPEERITFFKVYLKDKMLEWQKDSLERFGVTFDHWASEKAILERFSIEKVVDFLKERGDVYEEDGAIWFMTEKYGDDKDRVLIKKDGSHTYVVSDASYHKDKFERGYSHLINVWGPDHHGHVKRVKAAVESFGFDPEHLEIIIVQQVSVVSGGKKQKMSKREGKYITLDTLLDEVNKDAVRFFFIMRRNQAHLDFDIDLAKKLSLENPVYYTQYTHARTVNIFAHAEEKGISVEEEPDLSLLTELQEREIAKQSLLFPEVVMRAVEKRDVHRIPYYLLDLSKAFHSYYQRTRIVTDDIPLSIARLFLVRVVQQVMRNGLTLIGVSAPDRM